MDSLTIQPQRPALSLDALIILLMDVLPASHPLLSRITPVLSIIAQPTAMMDALLVPTDLLHQMDYVFLWMLIA